MTDAAKKDGNIEPAKEGRAAEPAADKADKATMLAAGKKEAAEPKKEGAGGHLMYVGPTVPGIGIQNRVYTEIPEEAAERAKETPEIVLLFIPVEGYPMASKMLREKTGYIYDAYCKAASLRKGGGRP